MSIRENRSVITTGVTAVFLSPLDVHFAYLTYMPTRRNVHQISTNIFHPLSMPPGVFQDAFILIMNQICHVLFRG